MSDIRLSSTADMGDITRVLARAANPNLGRSLQQANTALLRVAQVYPPPPPGSTYRRTDALKWGWQPIGPFQTATQGAAGAVNEEDHAEYVMGDQQAAIHQGRWKTVNTISADMEPQVVGLIEADLDRQLGGQP